MSKAPRFLLILVLISISYSYPVTDPCRWTDPQTQNSYDFTSLSRPEGWKVPDINLSKEGNLFNIDFFFSFCSPLKTTCDGKSNLAVYEALEVMGQVTDACEVLGKLDQMDIVTGTSKGLPGVKITFQGGDMCLGSENPSQNGNPMSATFNIICSDRRDDQFQQIPFNGNSVTKCTPEFFIFHEAGCVGGAYQESSSVFRIVIFLLVVYVVVRTIENIKVHKKQGLDALPHIDMLKKGSEQLKGFPVFMKDTVEKVVQKFKKGQQANVGGGLASSTRLTGGSKSASYTLV